MIKGKCFKERFIFRDEIKDETHKVRSLGTSNPFEEFKQKMFPFVIQSDFYGYNWLGDIILTSSRIQAFNLGPPASPKLSSTFAVTATSFNLNMNSLSASLHVSVSISSSRSQPGSLLVALSFSAN